MTFGYQLAYAASVCLFLVSIALGAVQAAYASGHGAELGLSPQVQAWLAVVSAVVAAALAILPRVTLTPGARETKYLQATQGVLPEDLRDRYPIIATVQEPPLTTSSPPTTLHRDDPP